MGHYSSAITLYQNLKTLVPCDPGVYATLGALASKTETSAAEAEANAYNQYMESYRYFPSSLTVVSWLGSYYIKSEAFEKAIPFLERAIQLQPDDLHWQLMCASCNRRTGKYQQALELLEDIHQRHPDNIECIRSLAQLCKELDNKHEDQIKYESLLRKLERERSDRGLDEEEEDEEEEDEEPLSSRFAVSF
jgi:intraflagellar transport protein 88